jgi:3-phosphoshikimate 1-carboxyvinyltransferase
MLCWIPGQKNSLAKMDQSFKKINQVSGEINLPGDKSISHRALLISSLAEGKSEIINLSDSEDIKSTINCLQKLGIEIRKSGDKTTVYGRGFQGYQKPLNYLNAGNSGTTARLLSGVLVAQKFDSVITGDKSLSLRPMLRLTEPLTKMGARISISENGTLPAFVSATDKLNAIEYQLPVPSAQVKSAILFAGLHVHNLTKVIEVSKTRNHTENLLDLKVELLGGKIISHSSRDNYPVAKYYFVPGDISSALFFVVLTLLRNNSNSVIKNVSLNSSRTEAINILISMGADIRIEEIGISNNEPFGNLIIRSSELKNIKIDNERIPLIIDEIPILTIAGIFADGNFELRGAKELRVKESDRIRAICTNLKKTGLKVEEYEDGFMISGEVQKNIENFESFGDHRIAMTFAIVSSLLNEGGKVADFDCVRISNPDFLKQLDSITN